MLIFDHLVSLFCSILAFFIFLFQFNEIQKSIYIMLSWYSSIKEHFILFIQNLTNSLILWNQMENYIGSFLKCKVLIYLIYSSFYII